MEEQLKVGRKFKMRGSDDTLEVEGIVKEDNCLFVSVFAGSTKLYSNGIDLREVETGLETGLYYLLEQ